MLTAKEIRDKIFMQAEVFKCYYRLKDWPRAKSAYRNASIMAVMSELDVSDLVELFGSRAYTNASPPTRGLFNEDMVQKVYWECIRINQTDENEPYPGVPMAKKIARATTRAGD